MTRKRKILVGGGVVLLLGVLVFQALRADRGDAVEIRAEEVGRQNLVARVTASGHIEPKRSVEIRSDISGRVVELPVDEGQDVEAGDLLLVIDPTQFEAAVRRARASLAEARAMEAQANADYLQAERDWARMEQLKERTPDLVTDQEAEQARTQAEVQHSLWQAAQHSVEQAQAAVAEAQDRLDRTVIRAPMSGRVTRLSVEQGETAIVGTMNNPGSLLLTVADLSVMEAVIEVDETDIPQVAIGDAATVEVDAFPDRTFAGRVTKIGNSAMQPRGTATTPSQDEAVDFEVRITLEDPPPGIRPDLSCTADVVTAERPGALSVPIISLTLADTTALGAEWRDRLPEGEELPPGDEIEGAFVVRGDRVRFQPVRIGIAGESHFEVLAGLAEGDTVVSGTYQAIRELEDGDPVRLERVADAGAAAPVSDTAGMDASSDTAGMDASSDPGDAPETDGDVEPGPGGEDGGDGG